MQIAAPSCLVLRATPHMGSCLRAARVRPKAPIVCQAGGLQRNCQLAAAALLSSAALQYTIPLDPAVCASMTAVRSPLVGHTLAVKRALLEDLLMQEVASRLTSMSDEDLVTVLEQVHQGRFQLPAAASSPNTPQPSSDTLSGAVAPSKSTSSASDSSLALSLADRQNATDMPGLSSTVQGGQQTDKQAQPAATSPTGKAGADLQDAATAKSLPDAWQQQTFSLQAFTKPLMQRLQGSASTQASPSGADSGLVAGQGVDNNLTSNADQQSRQSSQPRSGQLQSSQAQASQPESSQPASVQQQSGDKEQHGASLAAGPAFGDQGSTQEKLAQSRPPPGQAVSSEELTSSEKGLSQGGLLQSVEGSKAHDEGAEAGMAASSSRDMSTLNVQDAGSDEEGSGASGKGQNVDEAEDTTTRMLESAGVPLPTSALNKPTVSGAEKQPDGPSSVREYLGLVWRRAEPQLVLLVIASTISTLAGTLAQLAAARSHQHAAALLPRQHQHQSSPQAPGDNAQPVIGGQQRFASLRQAMWQGLLARLGRNMPPESARQAELGQADAAAGSSQIQAATASQRSGGRLDNGNGLPSPVESASSGQNHSRQEDEWGRPIVQIPMASGNGLHHHHQASDAGQIADKLQSKVLWVRKDPEEHGSSNGTELSNGQTDPRTVLWQRGQAHNHAAEQADGAPRRFRRSRLGKHAVSIESLLDNVE